MDGFGRSGKEEDTFVGSALVVRAATFKHLAKQATLEADRL